MGSAHCLGSSARSAPAGARPPVKRLVLIVRGIHVKQRIKLRNKTPKWETSQLLKKALFPPLLLLWLMHNYISKKLINIARFRNDF